MAQFLAFSGPTYRLKDYIRNRPVTVATGGQAHRLRVLFNLD